MDQINQLRQQLRDRLVDLLGSSSDSAAAREDLQRLANQHSGCAELALVDAAIRFFRDGGVAGIESVAQIAARMDDRLYTVGCMSELGLSRIRALSEGKVTLLSSDYINFIFVFNYVRQRFGSGNELYDWISYEWSKQKKIGNHNELYLLRCLTLSLGRGLLPPHQAKGITELVESMDEQLVSLLKKRISLDKPKPKPNNAKINRIAICAGLLKHSPKAVHARLVIDYALSLAINHPELHVLIINSNEIPFASPLYSYDMFRVTSAARERLAQLAADMLVGEPGERVEFVDMALENDGKWQNILAPIQRVVEFNPDAIMYFGAKHHNESFFTRRVLFDWYPTAYFFSQMNNGVDRYNDIYLARNACPLVGSYDPSRVRVAPPPVRPEVIRSAADAAQYSENQVKAAPGEVTLISVMAGYRMARFFRHYTPQVRALMMKLLDEPNVRWIWLGPDNTKELLSIDSEFARRYDEGSLEIREFDPNLGAVYEHCDLFLHLPLFTGGGGGVVLALERGLPVLCFENSDASTLVLPECVFPPADIRAYFLKATELIRNNESRRRVAKASANYYRCYSTETAARLSYAALQEAAVFFNQRIAGHPSPRLS